MPKTEPKTLYVQRGHFAPPPSTTHVATPAEILAHPACAAVVAERDRLVVLVRAALAGKLAGPWKRDRLKGGTGWKSDSMRSEHPDGPPVMLFGHQDDEPTFCPYTGSEGDTPGAQADADAWLIAHGWTLMTPADQALLDRGGE